MAGGAISSGNGKEYPGKLTWFVIFTCAMAGCGGLMFGYDIGISGGVTAMSPFLKEFFPKIYRKQSETQESSNQYCKFNSVPLTMFTSSLYLAALLATVVASFTTRYWGRKISMLIGGLTFCAGALLNGFAQAIWMLIVGRILLGVGIGFANQVISIFVNVIIMKNQSSYNVQKYQYLCFACFSICITMSSLKSILD